MKNKVVSLFSDHSLYIKKAISKREEGKFLESLGFLFTAYKIQPKNCDIIAEIARTYAEMELLDVSCKYWFLYLEYASEDKLGVAYEELGKNYYNMENMWASGYYFHLKLTSDGYISRESLSEELLEFLSNETDNSSKYYIAYPYDRADYSSKINLGKKAFTSGDFKRASAIFSSIPKECMDEDANGDFALSYFLQQDEDSAIDVCRQSLKENGETVTAYCNLSTLYFAKEDEEKSRYYYQKAISIRNQNVDDDYKILTCATNLCDHKTVASCLHKILKEREYDPFLNFLYGCALANTGAYLEAFNAYKKTCLIAPENRLFLYCLNSVERILNGEKDIDKFLPVKYDLTYPDKISRAYKKAIHNAVIEDSVSLVKSKQFLDVLYWGVRSKDDATFKKSSAILALSENKKIKDFLYGLLLDPSFADDRKRHLVFTLILCAKRNNFGIVAGNCYLKVKLRKLLFENAEDGNLFLSAYATCIAKAVFLGIDNFDKIGFSINKIYKRFAKVILFGEFLPEEVAALAFYMSDYKHFNDLKKVCKIFNVSKKRIKDFAIVLKDE